MHSSIYNNIDDSTIVINALQHRYPFTQSVHSQELRRFEQLRRDELVAKKMARDLAHDHTDADV